MIINCYNLKQRKDRVFLEKSGQLEGDYCNSPEKLFDIVKQLRLFELAEEYVYCIAFNSAMKPLGVFEISHGSARSSVCNPREILIRALLVGATGICVIHNHPSLRAEPSSDDRLNFKLIKDASTLIGVELIDYLIAGSDYYSFSEHGEFL